MKRPAGDSIDPINAKKHESEGGAPRSPDPSASPAADQWEEHVSKTTGKVYWYNPTTGVTQWTPPANSHPRSPQAEHGHVSIGPQVISFQFVYILCHSYKFERSHWREV